MQATTDQATTATARVANDAAVEARVPNAFERAFLSDATSLTEVLLIRHGQQEYDRNGPVRDMIDAPLSALGRAQARLVGLHLSAVSLDAVYSSPLQRARDTGREIARHQLLEPVIVDDLREIEIFRDIPPAEPLASYVGPYALRTAGARLCEERSWDVFPYSEPSFEFRQRVLRALDEVIDAHGPGRIGIACHGGVINMYIGHIIGSAYDMFFQPAHTSISVVVASDGRRALRSLNAVPHLESAEAELRTA